MNIHIYYRVDASTRSTKDAESGRGSHEVASITWLILSDSCRWRTFITRKNLLYRNNGLLEMFSLMVTLFAIQCTYHWCSGRQLVGRTTSLQNILWRESMTFCSGDSLPFYRMSFLCFQHYCRSTVHSWKGTTCYSSSWFTVRKRRQWPALSFFEHRKTLQLLHDGDTVPGAFLLYFSGLWRLVFFFFQISKDNDELHPPFSVIITRVIPA